LIEWPHDAEAGESIMKTVIVAAAAVAFAVSVGAGMAAPSNTKKGGVRALVSNTASLTGTIKAAPVVVGGVVLPNS
jgi:hypothetical protein